MESKLIENQLSSMFKNFETKPILFVGSGLSRRYLGLPNWEGLLKEFALRARPDDMFSYQYYKNRAQDIVIQMNLPSNYLLPTIADQIEIDYNRMFFDNPNFEPNIRNLRQVEILDDQSPFRLAICNYLENSASFTETYHDEKEFFLRLKDKVSNCITTNYDTFLENCFEDYTTLIGQDDLLNKNAGSIGVIYKIHGTLLEANSLVLTSKDYEQFDKKLKYLSAKLLTSFVEFPIIFIGYGVGDSNIRSILRDIKICLTPQSAERISNQMLFIELVDDISLQNIVSTEIEGIKMTKLLLNDYTILYKAFDNIVDTIDVKTLRQVESKISQLVQSTNFSVDRVYATNLENEQLNNDDLAIYIGHNSSVFNLGYEGIRLINICEDILFNTKSYDPIGILESTILSQKPFFSRSKIPLYKYISSYTGELDPFYEQSKSIISKVDDIYNSQDRKTRLYSHPIADLTHITGTNQCLQTKIYNIYLSLKALSIDEVKEYIKSIWSKKSELSPTTHLTKIVCVIDLHENKKTPI